MGCVFSRVSKGNKLSHEAVFALAGFGFSELGVHRINAETISKNLPTIKLCKFLGMRQETHLENIVFSKNSGGIQWFWQPFDPSGANKSNPNFVSLSVN